MLACVGHPALALAVVAVVAHVLGVMLFVEVVAEEVILHIDSGALAEHLSDLSLLEPSDLVLTKLDRGNFCSLIGGGRSWLLLLVIGIHDLGGETIFQFKKLTYFSVCGSLVGIELFELQSCILNHVLQLLELGGLFLDLVDCVLNLDHLL